MRPLQFGRTMLVTGLILAACRDTPTSASDDAAAFAVTVSNPVTLGPVATGASAPTSGVAANLVSTDPVAYVSVLPGTVPGGTTATITDVRTGTALATAVVDGGFDPVALPAAAGDTLAISVALAGGGMSLAKSVVPASQPPRVVRTSPVKGRTDVAINASIAVIFSEPVDPATVTPTTLRLLQAGQPVAGTVRPLAGSSVGMEFVPATPLAPATAYALAVDARIADLTGDHLEDALVADFTTTSSSAPLTVPPKGSRLVFTVQPTDATVLTPFAPAVSVTLVDSLGATLAGFSGDVALVLDQASGDQVYAWGSTSVRAVRGVATFSSVAVNPAGTGYTFSAVAGPAVSGRSAAFTVLPSPWLPKPYISGRRLGVATAVAGDRFYYIGGFNDQADAFVAEAKVEVFDPATNSWSSAASLPFGRIGAAAAELGGLIYVAGGAQDLASAPLATLQAYDPATDTWTDRAPMPTPRWNAAAAVVNGTLFVIGGSDLSGALSTVEAYDPVTNSWQARASMPTPRKQFAATALNGLIYAVGGFTSDQRELATVEAFDPGANAWTVRSPLSSGRAGAGGAVVGGLLYSIGGWGGPINGPMADVDAYDPATGSWTRRASLPMLGSAVAAATGGVIYAVVDGRQFYALAP